MALFERLALSAGWTEQRLERGGIEQAHVGGAIVPGVTDVLVVMTEVPEIQPIGAVRFDMNQLTHLLKKYWATVRRQAHYFVFVAEMEEAEKLGKGRIENTERMRKINTTIDLDIALGSHSPGSAGEVA